MRTVSTLLLLLLAWPGRAAAEGAIRPDRTIQLFGGQDLSRFYSWLAKYGREDPHRVFSVVDQIDGTPALRISGEDWGGLITKEAYRDYHLVVEFRWGLTTWGERRHAARDSGILIHCQGPDGNTAPDLNGPWMRSLEAQIIEGGVGDFILVEGFDRDGRRIRPRLTVPVTPDRDGEPAYDPKGERREFEEGRINWYGRDVDWEDKLGFRGRGDVESPLGQWTRLEVIANGDRVTNMVNGVVANRGSRSSLREGKILVQSEGSEIYFRRIELRPLPAEEKSKASSPGSTGSR
jgi:hypothetical protein